MKDLSQFKGFVDRTQLSSSFRPMFSRPEKDIPSGIVVFLVALPLCLGIALASGAPLISGLISGVIGGIVIGYISKSGTSVSGPAASVSAVVLVAIQDLGSFDVFLVALVLAGIFQIILGVLKSGLIADYMPTSIIKGLLAAIGIILIISQLGYAVGLDIDKSKLLSHSDNYLANTGDVIGLFFQSMSVSSIILTLLSLFILLFWDKTPLRNIKLIPPALVVVILGVLLNLLFKYLLPNLHLEGIHLVNIPKVDSLGSFITVPDFTSITNIKVWTVALTLAVIASLSSLLNIEATDNIDPHKRRTPPNRELIAQGIGNTLSGLVGGIAITSVIVRSSVNIEAGAETKLSTILHGFLLLLSVLFLSSVLNLIPLASLAAVLLVVGYKLASIDVFKRLYKKGWDQFLPFIVTVVAILLTDVLIGVLIGSAISIFFLLRGNYTNPFFITNAKLVQEEVIRLELSNEVSFLNKASIKRILWSIPDDTKVIIDATFSNYIDQDVIEILGDFENTVAREHNIQVNIIGLKEKYNLGEEIDFVEKKIEKAKETSSPREVLAYLKEGNRNFVSGELVSKRLRNKELADFLKAAPLAAVINCIDLREPLNMLFNTGIGDLVPIRAAGNVASTHVVHTAEISCRDQGAKLLLVMGNSHNAFIKVALRAHMAGEDSHLLPLIEDALASGKFTPEYLKSRHIGDVLDEITLFNLELSKQRLLSESTFIREQVQKGTIGVASAFFNRKTARVDFSELYTG